MPAGPRRPPWGRPTTRGRTPAGGCWPPAGRSGSRRPQPWCAAIRPATTPGRPSWGTSCSVGSSSRTAWPFACFPGAVPPEMGVCLGVLVAAALLAIVLRWFGWCREDDADLGAARPGGVLTEDIAPGLLWLAPPLGAGSRGPGGHPIPRGPARSPRADCPVPGGLRVSEPGPRLRGWAGRGPVAPGGESAARFYPRPAMQPKRRGRRP